MKTEKKLDEFGIPERTKEGDEEKMEKRITRMDVETIVEEEMQNVRRELEAQVKSI